MPDTQGPNFRNRCFPVRVAAIDLGSNAIRLLAAEFTAAGRWRALEQARAPVRTGREAFLSGSLSPAAVEAAVRALGGFRERLDRLGIRRYRAVATSAVRDSRNGGELVRRARNEAGLRLEAISGEEEARLILRAIRERFDLGAGAWVLVDLGGGSTEVSVVGPEGVRRSGSHRLGAVRLLDELGEEDGQSMDGVERALTAHPGMRGVTRSLEGLAEGAGMIATGGNIEALAELAGAAPDGRGVRILPVPRLRAQAERLSGLAPPERVRRLGLGEDRADVILPAAVVYLRLAELVGCAEVIVPGVGLKEGVLLDLVDRIGGTEPRS